MKQGWTLEQARSRILREEECERLELEEEKGRLNEALTAFADKMRVKLYRKAEEGRRGWRDPASRDELVTMLKEHLARGEQQGRQWVDVACFSLFLDTIEDIEDYMADTSGA